MTILDPNQIWRDYNTDGVPGSGAYDPDKAEIREWASTLNVAVYKSRSYVQTVGINSDVTALRTNGYSAAGDSGSGFYKRMSLADITSAGYPSSAYFRSTDRYMPDGSTDNTNGGYWVLQGEWVNPVQFGAAGDGSTDDTTACQDCADFAGMTGSNALLHKWFSVSSVEFNYKGVNVVGLGSDTGFIARSAASVVKTLLADRIIAGSMENLRFRDFAVDGNDTATAGFELERFTRGCELRGIYIFDCDGKGIDCYDSWSYGIDNCFVKNCTGWGIHMYGDNAQNNAWTCTNVEVTECGTIDGSAGGWRISDAQGGVMTGCISEYNKDQNFWVSGNSLIIEGNYFEGFSATRTVVGDAEYCVTLGSSTEALINSSFRNYVNGGSDGGSGFSGDGVRIRSVIATQIDCTFSASTRKTYVHLETDTFIGNEIPLGFDTHGASFKTASITNDTDAVTGGIEVLNGTSVYGNYGRRFGDSFGIRSDYQVENDGTSGSVCHWRVIYNQSVAFQFGKLVSTSDAFQFDAVESGNFFEFKQPAVLAPIMTSTERDALAVKKNGMIILNSTSGRYQGYKETGSTWVDLS